MTTAFDFARSHFNMLARYNRWANSRLYGAALALPDGDYRADRGVFFKSMHGTLNHLLAADRIWLHRFTGEGTPPTRLDAILFDDAAGLWVARQAEDERICTYVASLDTAALQGRFRYRPISNPALVEQSLATALDHVFNHQTHHRGQAHAILTGLGAVAPSLDLIYHLRESGRDDITITPD